MLQYESIWKQNKWEVASEIKVIQEKCHIFFYWWHSSASIKFAAVNYIRKTKSLKYLVAEDMYYYKFYTENLVLDFPACKYSLKNRNSFYKR